jgi:alkanesulfonate monooxygenase SsuD/methylene tetrahydromethanopterin reductase-like flavin-dependent oxidoreductase (luciferase family)
VRTTENVEKEQRLFQEFATLDVISHGRTEIMAAMSWESSTVTKASG